MSTCEWPECHVAIEKPPRGRPRKFCAEHASASAAVSKRLYKSREYEKNLAKAVDNRLPPCCQDCKRKCPKRRTCDQHQQWKQFRRDCLKVWRPSQRHSSAESLEESLYWDAIENGARITSSPDNWKP